MTDQSLDSGELDEFGEDTVNPNEGVNNSLLKLAIAIGVVMAVVVALFTMF